MESEKLSQNKPNELSVGRAEIVELQLYKNQF